MDLHNVPNHETRHNLPNHVDLLMGWMMLDFKAISLKNKSRDFAANVHTGGSKSFARHAHEMEEKFGFAPSRAKLYIPTHQRADGTPINEVVAANIEKIEDLMKSQSDSVEMNSKGSIFWSSDDVYSQVFHKKERRGRVRGCGFGPTPKSSSSASSDSSTFNVADVEERMRDKATINELKHKVHSQESELRTLKEQMAFVMRNMNADIDLQVLNGSNNSGDQASPLRHQRSSNASHDISPSHQGNKTI